MGLQPLLITSTKEDVLVAINLFVSCYQDSRNATEQTLIKSIDV